MARLFRLGDKVMQTQNNYDKDVYNGDIGFIHSMDMIEQTLTVDFDGRAVTYDWSEADQLVTGLCGFGAQSPGV